MAKYHEETSLRIANKSNLHLEVELDDRDVGQDGVGEHIPGIIYRALLGTTEELFLTHLAGDVLESLFLGVHTRPVTLLCHRECSTCLKKLSTFSEDFIWARKPFSHSLF
jgi:hypothetical protein